MAFAITNIENGTIERTCRNTGMALTEPLGSSASGDPMGPLHVTPSNRGLLPPPSQGQAFADVIGRTVIYWGRQSPHDDIRFIPRHFPRPDQATSYATLKALAQHHIAIGRLLMGERRT